MMGRDRVEKVEKSPQTCGGILEDNHENAWSWNDGNGAHRCSFIPLFQHLPVYYFLASLKFLTIRCALSVRTS